jgi:ribosomal protein S18 acetylase RimI-like enzyme
VFEETGLDVEIGPLLGRTLLPAGVDEYDVTDFAATVHGDPSAVVAGDDATDVRWVTREQFRSLPVSPGLAQELDVWGVWDQAMSNVESASYRVLSAPAWATAPRIDEAAALFADLVARGDALGWADPPSHEVVARLLGDVAAASAIGHAALSYALDPAGAMVGLGYWRRYERPTHWPHADLEKIAVAPAHQGRGVGRALMIDLVAAARTAGIEQLTLDARGDNESAFGLYRSLGFREYGRLTDFVAFGERRYDKVFMVCDLRD